MISAVLTLAISLMDWETPRKLARGPPGVSMRCFQRDSHVGPDSEGETCPKVGGPAQREEDKAISTGSPPALCGWLPSHEWLFSAVSVHDVCALLQARRL